MANPVIEAVEEGHVAHADKIASDTFEYRPDAVCLKDDEPMPCSDLRLARARNTDYAVQAQRRNLHSLIPPKGR